MPEPPVEEHVTWRVENGVAWITINRPDAGNSLTGDIRDRIGDLMQEASASLAVRAVVLGANGKHFCTGAALGGAQPGQVERPADAPERVVGDASRLIRRGWQRLVGSILDCEKPVLAAVNGTAAGGGTQLVLACDLVIMAEEARFIEVFVRRGIIPDAGGAYLLPRIIGLQKAKELMFFGDDVSAADAERIGLANRVVPLAELEKTVGEWAERLASAPTRALALTKWLLNRSFESSRQTTFEEEAVAQELCTATEDSREGMMSFMERRPPDFKGW